MSGAGPAVVVVGGGPGGAATALGLVRAGVRVTVVERASFPRDKVCGDVLLPEAQQVLGELGLDTRTLQQEAVQCTGLRYVGWNGTEVADEFRDHHGHARPWWIVRRRRFDAWLMSEAQRRGVEVLTGHTVVGVERARDGRVVGVHGRRTDGAPFRLGAPVVIAADGAMGVIARALGLASPAPRDTCVAVRGYARGVTCPDPYLEVFTTPRTLPGTAWILPVGDGQVNLGLGILRATSDALGRSPQQLFREVCADHPRLAQRLAGAELGTLQGWVLPGATEHRALVRDNVLLVGDAGALVDPFTGHGIHQALRSGLIAAEVVAAAAGDYSDARLQPHHHRCRAAFARELALGAKLQELHAQPALVGVGLRLAQWVPPLRRRIVGLVGHAAPRRDLLSLGALLPTWVGGGIR